MDDVCVIFSDIIFTNKKASGSSARFLSNILLRQMNVGNLDRIMMRVGVNVAVYARLRLVRLQIVLVRLEHILDKTLHRICTIYLHRETPSYDCLLQPQNIMFLHLWKIFLSDKIIVLFYKKNLLDTVTFELSQCFYI